MRSKWIETRGLAVALIAAASLGCTLGNPTGQARSGDEPANAGGITGDPVSPPFAVSGELEGLFLVWFDAEGTHTASSRSDIPEAHREHVRVDSLALAPDQRLDPELVYLADVRAAGSDGQYPVRQVPREAFERLVASGRATAQAVPSDVVPAAPGPSSAGAHAGAPPADGARPDVIIYGASWCGACHSAARWLAANNVPFVEKDIERDPGAREEMTAKANAAGIGTGSIPVIDVRGQILQGFDAQLVQQILSSRPQPI